MSVHQDVPGSGRDSPRFWLLVAVGAIVLAIGLAAAHWMETQGHVVTGMNNHVVWGIPHVFAIFLIVAASGVLNIASVGSVFGRGEYKARSALSGLLSLAMLSGGLMVLMLDLGRPERFVVAATHYNFTSVFAWNVFLYSGMFGLVAAYLWTTMERRMAGYSKPVGFAVFVWRLVLTTGTGSIFGFLVARQAYASAMLAPMFVVLSFAWGLAVFLLAQASMYAWNRVVLSDEMHRRLRNLLGVFVGAGLYFVAMHHLTNAYFARNLAFERFVLVEGGAYTLAFWLGQVVIGGVVPLALIFAPGLGGRMATVWACLFVVTGAFCGLYALIVAGQAYPLDIFPGKTVSSSFMDGQIAPYSPSLPEILLGLGGVAAAFLITTIGVRVLPFMPTDAGQAPASPVPR